MGGATGNIVTKTVQSQIQPQQVGQGTSLPPGASPTSIAQRGAPTQQTSFNPQQHQQSTIQVTSSKGQLLMQQLTSGGPSRGSQPLSGMSAGRSISYIEATPSNSPGGGSLQQGQPQQLFVTNNGTPQVLVKRSSFSGISPASTRSGLMSSPTRWVR